MIFKLSKSLIRSNKIVTAAMLIMYVIIMALLVMLNFFSDSFDESLDSYMNEYGYPQTVICSRDGVLFTQNDVDYISSIEGAETVSPRMTVDYFTDLENERYLKLRYNTVDENLKFYDVENDCTIRIAEDSVMVPYVFAKANNIKIGDELKVKTASGINTLKVTNIISCPETISVKRASFENYDDNDFTYIYISEEIGQKLNSASGVYNQILVMGDENKVIGNLMQTSFYSRGYIIGYSSSNINHQIKNSTDASRAAIIYMVVFIAVIGTVFTALFINQIVLKSRKFIALLRALGMDKNKVILVFLIYVISIILAASVLGVGIGYVLLRFILGIYKDYFVMPGMVVSGSILKMLGLLLAEFAIGTTACIMSAGNIAKIDPVGVFNAGVNGSKTNVELPKFLERTVKDGFAKISLCGVLRNKRRIAITILCNIACITLTCASIEIITAKKEAFDYNLNNRMQYDLIVGTTDEDLAERIKASDDVAAAESITRMSFSVKGENLLINAFDGDCDLLDMRNPDGETISLPEYGIILEEGYAERNGYEIGDKIKLGEAEVEVKELCREYIVPVAYMSQKQLEATGYGGHNALIVLTTEDARYYNFAHKFDDVDYIIYTTYRGELAVQTMNKLDAPCKLFIVCAILLGLVIVYNINQLSIMEREKELRTLRLLGTNSSEFLKMLSIEALAEYIPAVIIGPVVGLLSSRLLELGMSSMSMHYVMTRPLYVAVMSCLLVLIYIVLSIAMNMRNIKKL